MTEAQKRLRDLRDRQSRERGRMAELSLIDELGDEHRAELDTIEKGTPDLERQLRAATIALELRKPSSAPLVLPPVRRKATRKRASGLNFGKR